jgi:hypothetical protein
VAELRRTRVPLMTLAYIVRESDQDDLMLTSSMDLPEGGIVNWQHPEKRNWPGDRDTDQS